MILEVIHERGPVSRAQAARETGLSKPTVSLVFADLVDSGLVRDADRKTGGRRPTILYELNPDAGWVVGIDVGRYWLRAAIADIAGTVVARRDERARVRSAHTLVDQIGAVAHELADEVGIRWRRIVHATVGSPGVFDPVHGVLQHAPNLPGWGRQGLAEAVRERLGTDVTFENDVNLAALGEGAQGLGRGVPNFVLLWVGTGVGVGLVLGGQLYRGSTGAAGEIGYLPIGAADPHESSLRRRGAFEEAAGAPALVRAARKFGMRSPVSAKQVFAAARRGDRPAMRAVEREAEYLALAVASIASLLDPELVILGGGVGQGGDLLVAPLDRELRRVTPFRPRIAISALGEDAVLQGAVATALVSARDRLFARVQSLTRSAGRQGGR